MSDVRTTTQTSVSSTPPAAPQTYDNQGVIVLVSVVVMFMITFSNGIGDLVAKFRGWKKGRVDEEKSILLPLEKRVGELETAARTFRSSDYLDREFNRLENKIDHNKANISMCLDQVTNMHRGLASDVADTQRGIVRLEQAVKGVESNAARVESAVDKLSVRIEERLDKFQESLSLRITPNK